MSGCDTQVPEFAEPLLYIATTMPREAIGYQLKSTLRRNDLFLDAGGGLHIFMSARWTAIGRVDELQAWRPQRTPVQLTLHEFVLPPLPQTAFVLVRI